MLSPICESYVRVSALAVFFAHVRGASFVQFAELPATQQIPLTMIFFGLTRLAQEAVLIFFVLSGFLVGGQIISRIGNDTFDICDYAADRLSRILLPLVPACLITVAVNIFIYDEPLDIGGTLGNMVGLNGVIFDTLPHNTSLWTLAFEIWFYIFGGVVGLLLTHRGKTTPIAIYLVFFTCIFVFSVLSARFLVYWVAGAFTFSIKMKFEMTLGVVGLLTTGFAVTLNQLSMASKSFVYLTHVSGELTQSFICIGLCLCFPALCNSKIENALRCLSAPAYYISSISYTLYLVHTPINSALDFILPKSESLSTAALFNFCARCGGCIFVAVVIYFCFEKQTPLVRRYVKERIFHRRLPLGEEPLANPLC